jgi:hypothetical protein
LAVEELAAEDTAAAVVDKVAEVVVVDKVAEAVDKPEW